MRLIILAAGSGRRLGKLTENRPKCMVPLHGKPLVEWLLGSVAAAGITDVVVVRGFAADKLQPAGVEFAENPRFAETNMVYSLWSARKFFTDPFILSYADILYEPDTLRKVAASDAEVGVALDKDWQSYWTERLENPLDDVETLKLSPAGSIVELGSKAERIEDIAGGYIGLIKFAGKGLQALSRALDDIRAGTTVRGRDFDGLYMTDLLQHMCDTGAELRPVFVNGGWFEVDTPDDLALAQRMMSVDPACEAGFRIGLPGAN